MGRAELRQSWGQSWVGEDYGFRVVLGAGLAKGKSLIDHDG